MTKKWFLKNIKVGFFNYVTCMKIRNKRTNKIENANYYHVIILLLVSNSEAIYT